MKEVEPKSLERVMSLVDRGLLGLLILLAIVVVCAVVPMVCLFIDERRDPHRSY